MPIQRRIERHQLPYYLKVFNSVTDKPMGYIGNVSVEGMLLISQYPVLVGAEFDMCLKVPGQGTGTRLVSFSAICQWSREDVTPGTYDSGFYLEYPPADYLDMVAALSSYFSFRPLSTPV